VMECKRLRRNASRNMFDGGGRSHEQTWLPTNTWFGLSLRPCGHLVGGFSIHRSPRRCNSTEPLKLDGRPRLPSATCLSQPSITRTYVP
jgi:hypothetical protein